MLGKYGECVGKIWAKCGDVGISENMGVCVYQQVVTGVGTENW